MYEVFSEITFSGAHRLREYEGRCESLHGHNWRIRVFAASETLDRLGLVVDFKLLKKSIENVAELLDHAYLNEVSPFDSINPSAENIAKFFYEKISNEINDGRVSISRVMVWESEKSCAIFTP